MLNIKDYKGLKANKAIKFKKKDDKYIAIITTFHPYSGKKITKEEEINIERYKMEKNMFENEMNRAKKQLEEVNLLLNNINA